jgi:hypothetical protein
LHQTYGILKSHVFWDVLPQSPRRVLKPEEKGIMILLNIQNYSFDTTAHIPASLNLQEQSCENIKSDK